MCEYIYPILITTIFPIVVYIEIRALHISRYFGQVKKPIHPFTIYLARDRLGLRLASEDEKKRLAISEIELGQFLFVGMLMSPELRWL